MPLDLDEIRARHEPYADTRVGQDIAALLSEVARLRSELAAAQAGPVVEWHEGVVGERALCGLFVLTVGDGGWALKIKVPLGSVSGDLVDLGPETGPEGKAKAVAAWQRACGGAQ